eukprot:134474_1
MIGGSGYVEFNVSYFLQYGAIVHLSFLGYLCFYTYYARNINPYAVCVGFILCVPMVVIGFLLHSEMTPENVKDDAQCIDMVFAWSMIKLIEWGGIPCLGCCFAMCASLG